MSLRNTIAAVAASLGLVGAADAGIVTESSDFGAFPSSAGIPSGMGSIDRIVGSLYTGGVLGDFADAVQFKATSNTVSVVFDNGTNTPFANWIYLYDSNTSMPIARGSRTGLVSRLDWNSATVGGMYTLIFADSPLRPLGINGLEQFTYGNTGSTIAANGPGAGVVIGGYNGSQNPLQRDYAYYVSGAEYPVPAPGSMALLGAGLLVAARRRSR